MRAFASRIELESSNGDHLRRLPAALAKAMVDAGTASIWNQNGKVKSIRLIGSAATSAERIGEPDNRLPFNTRFTRIVKTEAGVSWIEHHPRATYEPPE